MLFIAAVVCILFVALVVALALFWGRGALPRSALQACLKRRNPALKGDTEEPPRSAET